MFFNNCANRNHIKIYGPDAFYDLGTSGHQGGQARNLRPGDLCIVASYQDKAKTSVKFSWFSFEKETLSVDENGEVQRVLRGPLKKTESMSKVQAAANPQYANMFNVLGHFKRPSVIRR
jgi:aspartate 1-decarboxylase